MKCHLRRALPLAAAILLLAQRDARADDSPFYSRTSEQPNALSFNLGDLLNGTISVEYERAVATWFGIGLGLSVSAFRGPFSPSGSSTYLAFGPEIFARFHFIQDAPAGLWVGPSLNAGFVASGNDGSVGRAFYLGVGAAIGYNIVLFRHFLLQLGIGGNFREYGAGLVWYPRFIIGLGAAF